MNVDPPLLFDGFISTTCSRHDGSGSSSNSFDIGGPDDENGISVGTMPPATFEIALPTRRPASCSVYADAYLRDFEATASISIDLNATQYPKKKKRR